MQDGNQENSKQIKKEHEATGNSEALNVYLLVGAYQAGNRLDTLVLHDISLVVSERISATSGSTESTLHQWILLDKDADGVLDKAIFIENPEGTAGSQKTVDILHDQRANLQGYFDKALRNLNEKASEGSADACIPS